jgi:23S rRNA (cytosine1962-C5)-methyltransferase
MPSTLPVVQIDSDQLPAGPWVFARQIGRSDAAVDDGSLVEVHDRSGRFFGVGLFNGASDIRVRLLSRGKRSDVRNVREFLLRKLANADRLRRKVLRLPEVADAYRVAHAEGDDLSGLVVDRLGSVLVCEHHALGFWKLRGEIEWALRELYPDLDVIHRVPKSAAKSEGFEPEEATRDVGTVRVREHEIAYPLRPGQGHKTGFFCDQRDNRLTVARLARGADVLDLCCNTGGFALQAKRLGARSVRGVDLDENVVELARAAARENQLDVEIVHADAFDVLRAARGARERPGVVVLDPHKIIRQRAQIEEGLRRYGDLNTLALEVVRPGGLLATFSCSGALETSAFVGMLFQSARRAERGVRLLASLGAGPDHPQRPEFGRSRYLKGALLAVD